MATSDGAIPLGCKRAMAAKSQPAEAAELVGLSSPAMTPPPSTAMRAFDDGDSEGDDEAAKDLARLTDHELQESIKRTRHSLGLCARLPDGGVKFRRNICRMEKELDRRRAAGPRKGVMTWRLAVQSPSQDDSHAFKDGNKLNWGNTSSKYHQNVPITPTTNYGQAEDSAFFKELSYFGREKHACLKKVAQSSRTPVSHQPKNHAVCPKRADDKQLHMDNNIIDNERNLGSKSCLRKRQKNNSFDSNGMYDKLHAKDVTLGKSTKRWEHTKNHITEFGGLFDSKERNKRKDVVLLDDEDIKPAESINVEMAHKWTDLETFELICSDMECLEPEEYLKSPVINFYMQYLRKSRTCGELYIFNTYFYSKLEKVLSRMANRFGKHFNMRMHWSLIIICMPAKETESGPIILHLDSLGLHSSREVFDVIESFLIAEWQHLQNDSSYTIPFSGRIWNHLSKNINKEKVEVPSQRNKYDCGIFMLHYIERFIQEAPERLTRENLCMFGRKWFDPKETSGLRDRIRALMFDAFESARMDDESSQSESHSDDQSGDEDKDRDAVMVVVID
uniref:Ubiquitin-like protease family profile domain-containing protein n=1 Tax=Oryza punctata TaxID=4537 RepID=A0A0E0JIF3_ORYPU